MIFHSVITPGSDFILLLPPVWFEKFVLIYELLMISLFLFGCRQFGPGAGFDEVWSRNGGIVSQRFATVLCVLWGILLRMKSIAWTAVP
jgi:hypothetical protein